MASPAILSPLAKLASKATDTLETLLVKEPSLTINSNTRISLAAKPLGAVK